MDNTPLNYYRYLLDQGINHQQASEMVRDAVVITNGHAEMKKPDEMIDSTIQELRDAGVSEDEILAVFEAADKMMALSFQRKFMDGGLQGDGRS